jgi:DNA-binding transcriptional ArsR family regulator
VDDLVKALQALSDPTRFAVFQCIRGCGGETAYDTETGECDGGAPGAIAVCDVRCKVPCAPSTLSHHLNVLRDASLIETERKGRMTFARIRPERLHAVARFFAGGAK